MLELVLKISKRAKAVLLAFGIVCAPIPIYGVSAHLEAALPSAPSPLKLAHEQQKKLKVTGVIRDNEGLPLVGVNVREEDTNNGAITNERGYFALQVKPGSCLIFSYIGFKEKRLICTTNQDLDLELEIDRKLLEEVVVVGYGTQKKVNLTGALDQVESKALKDRPIVNIASGLQGLVPNLNIESGTGTRGGTRLNIRGMTSFNQAQPLVLVDNVEMSLDQINPADVESISVLKDASSAAIYGARAAYGVLLITTRSGQKSAKPIVQVSAMGYWQKPIQKPKLLNSLQYLDYIDAAYQNSDGDGHFYNPQIYEGAQKYFNDPKNNESVFFDPKLDPSRYQYVGNTNWWNQIYKPSSFSQQYNASISGGNERTTYYSSFTYNGVDGLYKQVDDTYQKYNAFMHLRTSLTDWISVSGKMAYNYGKQEGPSHGRSYGRMGGSFSPQGLSPLMPTHHPDGNYSGQGRATNPISLQKLGGKNLTRTNYTLLSTGLHMNPLAGLVINFDYTYSHSSYNNQQTGLSFYEYRAVPGMEQLYPSINPSSISLANTDAYSHAVNLFAEYTKSINEAHNFKALIGYNQEYNRNKYMLAARQNLINQELPSINGATGEKTTDGSETHYSLNGLFMRFNYDYKGRYLIEFNGRYDGSSRYPKGERYKFFPSASAGWRISEEPLWKQTTALDWWTNLKFRFSYGSLGNQALVGDFGYLQEYNTSESYYILGGQLPKTIGAPELISGSITWETVNQTNWGIDLGFLSNRLTASLDIYRRDTKDMLWNGEKLPAVLGSSIPKENSANLKTTGFEVSIGWIDQLNNGLNYWGRFFIGDSKTTITKVLNPTNSLQTQFYQGQRYGEIWGYESNGLFQNQEEVDKWADQSRIGQAWGPGDVKYEDLNGDGFIDYGDYTVDNPGDMKIIGNGTPRYNYGFNLGFEYKGFDLSMHWQGVMKRDAFLTSDTFWGINEVTDTNTAILNPHTFTLDYWTPDNPTAYYPRPKFQSSGNRMPSTRYMRDASYLRLKTLDLGYTLPREWSRLAYIQNARIFVSMENLFTFSDLPKAIDPEDLSSSSYPRPRKFSVGVNLTF